SKKGCIALVDRVIATKEALELIERLKKIHGDSMFHQSGGCCDGSSPMFYPRDEFRIGDSDMNLGELGHTPFYMAQDQYKYWHHTQLILDVVEGARGMDSREEPEGNRFLTS